jgi:predicted DNA-binding transcriptional regulator AlpA
MEDSPKQRSLSRASVVQARCADLSNQQRLRLEEKGEFPHRVYIAPTIVAYYDDEVDEWIASRVRKGGRPVVRNPRRRAQTRPEATDAVKIP